MDTTVEACEKRDDAGHYAKARSGEYKFFPGVDVDYEVPNQPEIVIPIDQISVADAADRIVRYLKKNVINGKNQL